MKPIFEYDEYKKYLCDRLGAPGMRTGSRAALAQHLGCQTAYVSQILSAHAHLSFEQAFKTNSFLGHDKDSAEFFLLLVQKARAGTVEVESYFARKISELRDMRAQIKSRVATTHVISEAEESKYYSSWLYGACRVAITVPELQSPKALATRLRVDESLIREVLEFLVHIGQAVVNGDHYQTGSNHIHLSDESPNILRHHANWRLQALKSLDAQHSKPLDVHYAVTYSLAKEDVSRLRENILKLIKENMEVVRPSKEETIFCNVIDFFEI